MNSSSVLTTSSSAKVLLPHLTLEAQTIRPGSKITVQGKLLGSGRRLLQRQIDSYFPPAEEDKLLLLTIQASQLNKQCQVSTPTCQS